MGVYGLTTFIANDADQYLKPTKLKDCHLIVDGSCIASHLFKWRTKRDSAFGGDYDEYWLIVQSFFNHLKKCRITPIVVMDGGYEERKLPTVQERLKQKILVLKSVLTNGFSDIKFFPLFMYHVFCEAVKSLKIQLIMCEFEADGEIAALARRIRCPVLSLDSDFFIYDVLYVPFSSMGIEPVEEDGSYGFSCSIYDVEEFLKLFPGLNKKHLPLVAVLLGNDFNDHSVYRNFYLNIPLKNYKRRTQLETRILGLLNWLATQSEEGAVKKVKECLDSGEAAAFEKAFADSKANYSFSGQCKVQESADGKVEVHPPVFTTRFHPLIREQLTSLNLPPFLITLVTLRTHIPTLMVENIQAPTCHTTSLNIIEAIDRLLCSYTGDVSALHTLVRERSSIKELYGLRHYLRGDQTYDALMKKPMEDKKSFMYNILTLDDPDKKCLENVIPESQLFMASFMLWSYKKSLSPYLSYAMLLCYIACQAKNRVGYFRVGKDSKLPVEEVSAFVALLAPYRKTTKGAQDSYSTAAVHELSRFQSILYYSSVLNSMLGCPFLPCKITESFSGTVAYNLFVHENRFEFYELFHEFLQTAPWIRGGYTLLMNLISPYVQDLSNLVKKKKKKKSKKKSVKEVHEEEEKSVTKNKIEDVEDEDDYNDLSNKFNCLRTED